MEISSAQHQAVMSSLPLEEIMSGYSEAAAQQQQEKRVRPQPEQALKCPRCDSTNTKFCYYNNYSLSQPRYFCKGCRRYWTKGGSLRNVPVGGGCRRNKRLSSSSLTNSKKPQELKSLTTSIPPLTTSFFPVPYDPIDPTLAFARFHRSQQHTTGQLLDDNELFLLGNPNPSQLPSAPTGNILDNLKTEFDLDRATISPSGFNNLYYNYGGNNGILHGGSMMHLDGSFGSATTTTATTVTTTCKDMDGGDNKVLMGLQWQVGGNGNMAMDSTGRDHYWNGVSSTWHGLINSSLI